MRQKFILPIFLFLSSVANAQFTEPGQKLISGGIGLYQSKTSDEFNSPYYGSTDNNSYNINLAFGKFYHKNILTNLRLAYYHGNSSFINNPINPDRIENIQNIVGVSYGRTWYKTVAKKLYFGIGGDIGPSYGWSKRKQSLNGYYNKTEAFAIALQLFPLLDYQLSKRFVAGINPGNNFLALTYQYEKSEANTQAGIISGHRTSAGLSSGFFSAPLSNINLTFKYLFK